MDDLNERAAKNLEIIEALFQELEKGVVGQKNVLEKLLIAVLTGGHVLLEGVPGLAKTLMMKSIAEVFSGNFSRIQFTPDLLPSDLTGTLIYNPQKHEFTVKKGPLFANFILADEINRAPAKVQSALLEAMQEKQITIGDETYLLEEPFLVLATQNPIEQEGTYPLPEAQVDRFLMKVCVSYPTREEEKEVIRRITEKAKVTLSPVVSLEVLSELRASVRDIYVDDKIKDYVLDIVSASRNPKAYELEDLEPLIAIGASPRASISLIQAAKAHALMRGRYFVTPEDIKAIGKEVLRHRVMASFEAEAEEITSEAIVDRIFSEIDVP